jgi:hypothetical protein
MYPPNTVLEFFDAQVVDVVVHPDAGVRGDVVNISLLRHGAPPSVRSSLDPNPDLEPIHPGV